MTASDLLRSIGEPEIVRWLDHPTVTGLASGELPRDDFVAWARQDWIYLHHYVRVYASLAAVAPGPLVPEIVGMAHNLAAIELGLLRDLSDGMGFVIDGAEPAAVTAEYMEFLSSNMADFGLGLAAALPCLWGYTRLGLLLGVDDLSDDHPYAPWLKTYGGDPLRERVGRLLILLDAATPSPREVERLVREAFVLEWRFWDVPSH
ncbi:MAG: hypothetical protein RIE08_13900 [Acidimicrobiales bacterium]